MLHILQTLLSTTYYYNSHNNYYSYDLQIFNADLFLLIDDCCDVYKCIFQMLVVE